MQGIETRGKPPEMTRAHPLQLPPTAAPRSPATSPPERERSHPQRLSSLKDMGGPHVQLPPWCPTATSSAKRGRLRPQVSYLGATTPPPLICSTVTDAGPSNNPDAAPALTLDERRQTSSPPPEGALCHIKRHWVLRVLPPATLLC
jgi:hypothetical protein